MWVPLATAKRVCSFFLSPDAVVAFPWGSMSINSVLRLVFARAAERLTAVVVLPTPPFWFAIAITLFILQKFLLCSALFREGCKGEFCSADSGFSAHPGFFATHPSLANILRLVGLFCLSFEVFFLWLQLHEQQ